MPSFLRRLIFDISIPVGGLADLHDTIFEKSRIVRAIYWGELAELAYFQSVFLSGALGSTTRTAVRAPLKALSKFRFWIRVLNNAMFINDAKRNLWGIEGQLW